MRSWYLLSSSLCLLLYSTSVFAACPVTISNKSYSGFGDATSFKNGTYNSVGAESITLSFGADTKRKLSSDGTKKDVTLYEANVVSIESNADILNSLDLGVESLKIYWTYNQTLAALYYLGNGTRDISSTLQIFPGKCYIYAWFRDPSSVAKTPPPNGIFSISDNGSEITGFFIESGTAGISRVRLRIQ